MTTRSVSLPFPSPPPSRFLSVRLFALSGRNAALPGPGREGAVAPPLGSEGRENGASAGQSAEGQPRLREGPREVGRALAPVAAGRAGICGSGFPGLFLSFAGLRYSPVPSGLFLLRLCRGSGSSALGIAAVPVSACGVSSPKMGGGGGCFIRVCCLRWAGLACVCACALLFSLCKTIRRRQACRIPLHLPPRPRLCNRRYKMW